MKIPDHNFPGNRLDRELIAEETVRDVRRIKLSFLAVLSATFFLASCKSIPLTEMKIPFTGESVIDTIDGEPYRYFRYETLEATEADIAKISPDGSRIGGKRMRWEGPVHIFAFRKRIVMYVGSNPKVIETIEEVFGEQIAGDPIPTEEGDVRHAE